MEIKGNTALVTGGASGLGEAAVRKIAAAGGNVVIMDIQDESGEKLSAELGDAAIFVKTDVTSEEDVQAAIEAAREKFGGVHFCVNCAGTGLAARTVSRKGPADLKAFEWLIRLNLIGTYNVASKAAFAMTSNEPGPDGERGAIVNVASVAAFDGQIGQTAYAASKGGVAGMTLPMARDLSGVGIRVVTVAPGLFMTPLMQMMPEPQLEALGASVPFPKRLGTAKEFAMLVEQILINPYMNGETIRLDGAVRLEPK
jgi:NAD(P)-dependent dehydrogenase (short-subunit alcohol dehydrogenase family)